MLVQINNHSLHYIEQGQSDGRPVVFIHGFPFDCSMWQPQLAALPKRFHAIAYDVRGHGRSAVGDGLYSLEFFVDDLMALLDHLKLEQVVLCGLSMGGYIALRAVERHRERFAALVLCDTRSQADNDQVRVNRAAAIRALAEDGIAAFADNFLKLVMAPSTFQDNPAVVDLLREMIVATDPRAIGGTLMALAARTDTTAALPQLDLPALMLVGEQDRLTPPEDARALAGQLPRAELFVIPRAAHMSNLENPDYFNERLLTFLEHVVRSG